MVHSHKTLINPFVILQIAYFKIKFVKHVAAEKLKTPLTLNRDFIVITKWERFILKIYTTTRHSAFILFFTLTVLLALIINENRYHGECKSQGRKFLSFLFSFVLLISCFCISLFIRVLSFTSKVYSHLTNLYVKKYFRCVLFIKNVLLKTSFFT